MLADDDCPMLDLDLADEMQVTRPKKSRRSAHKASASKADEGNANTSPDKEDKTAVVTTFTLTWTKGVWNVQFRPDGRKCRICVHRDWDDDPVSKAVGIDEQCWWFYAPAPDGTTQGTTCGYCGRVHFGVARRRGISLDAYVQEIADGGDEALNFHLSLVRHCIAVFIAKGGNRRCQMNWNEAQNQCLKVVKSLKMNIKRPGWTFKEKANYDKEFILEDERKNGHVEFVFEGKAGVMIPDSSDIKIDFNEEIAAQLENNVASSADGPSLENEFENNLGHIAGRFMAVERDGSFEGVASLLSDGSAQAPLVAAKAPRPKATAAKAPQPSPPIASSKTPGNAVSMPAASPAKTLALPSGGSFGSPAVPKLKRLAPFELEEDQVEEDMTSTSSRAASQPQQKGPRGQSGLGRGKAAPKQPAPKKENRGRPPKDLTAQRDSLYQRVSTALASDGIFFGSEAKVGRALLMELYKACQARSKTSSYEPEILDLRRTMKATNALHITFEVIEKYGLGSEKFQETFDQQQTQCNLEPVAEVPWPKHILWERHRMQISAHTSVEMWIAVVASSELRKHGIDDVGGVQGKLIGEKVALCVKKDSIEEVRAALRVYFTLDREWPFEPQCADFCCALSMAMWFHEIKDLTERIELGDESVQTLEESVTSNSSMGNALVAYHKGKLVFEEFKLHIAKCKITEQSNKQLADLLGHLKSPEQDSEQSTFDAFIQALQRFFEAYQEASASCLQEFILQPTCAPIHGVAEAILKFMMTCWTSLLKPLDDEKLDSDSLKVWHDTSQAARSRMSLVSPHIEKAQEVFLPHTALPSHRVCLKFMHFAVDLHQITVDGFESSTRCAEIRQCSHSVLDSMKEDTFCQQMFGHLSSSPLLAKNGPVMTALVRGMKASVREPLRLLLSSIVDTPGAMFREMVRDDSQPDSEGPAFVWELVTEEVLVAAQGRAVDIALFSQVSEWAAKNKDTKLSEQVRALHGLYNVLQCQANAEAHARRILRPSSVPYKDKKISKETVEMLKKMMDWSQTFYEFVHADTAAALFCPDSEMDTLSNVVVEYMENFGGTRFPFVDVGKDVLQKSMTLEQEFGTVWDQHLKALSGLLEQYYVPEFKIAKETLLENDDVCRKMLANKEGYKRIGGIVGEVKESIDLCRRLRVKAHKPVTDLELAKHAGHQADDGIALVCYTFALFYVRREVPTFLCKDKVQTVAKKIRSKFSLHKVAVTQELDTCLKALETCSVVGAETAKWALHDDSSAEGPVATLAVMIKASPPVVSSKPSTPVVVSPTAEGLGQVRTIAGEPASSSMPAAGEAPKRSRLADRLRKRSCAPTPAED